MCPAFKALMCCIIISITFSVPAQIPFLSQSTHSPFGNESIERFEIPLPKISGLGDSLFWNYSKTQLGQRSVVRYQSVGDSIAFKHENKGILCYFQTADTLKISHYNRLGEDLTFYRPEIRGIYPILLGDSISFPYYAEGNYGRIAYLRNCGITSLVADGTGTLITPETDTIQNIIRIHYHTKGGLTFDKSFSVKSFSSLKDSSLISDPTIFNHCKTDSITFYSDCWQWYAPGYRHPVIERQDHYVLKNGTLVDSLSTAYYSPIHGMIFNEPTDEEKEIAQERFLQRNTNGNRYSAHKNKKEASSYLQIESNISEIKFDVTPKYVTEHIIITAEDINGICQLKIADATGKLLYVESQLKSTDFPKRVNMSEFAKGIYFIILEHNDSTNSIKILKH